MLHIPDSSADRLPLPEEKSQYDVRLQGEYLRIKTTDGAQIVLDREDAISRSSTIMRRYGVPSDRSDDVPRPKPAAPKGKSGGKRS